MGKPQSEEVTGCTVGAVPIPGGILFFKNRDLAGAYLAKRLIAWHATAEFHALRGANLKTGALEGVSIGVNRHRVCVANTHVASTPHVTYDVLCERLLRGVRQPGHVRGIVEAFLAAQLVQGARILVASPSWAVLVEVYHDRFAVAEMEMPCAITNTFSLLPDRVQRPAIREQSSATRLHVAQQHIETIRNIGQLKAMLRSHTPEKGELSICNHRQDGGGTESSHIIHIQGDSVEWSSLTGYPCENDYQTVPLFVE